VVVELWQHPEVAAPHLAGAFTEWDPAGLPVLMRRESARIDWRQLGESPKVASH
jgi:hypothetical protein